MNWHLHHGDAIEFMQTLKDESVDHTITDPPYSEHVHKSFEIGMNRDADRASKAAIGRTTSLGFSHITPELVAQTAKHLARVTKRWVLVFADIEGVPLWKTELERSGLQYVRTGIWVKPGAAPQFSGDRPGAGYEAIVIAHKPGRKRWNGGGKHGIWIYPIVPSGQRLHTTQKPFALMAALVTDFTEPGDTILDPYAGSGTTGAAALETQRRFVGSERDDAYYAIATKRLSAVENQPRLLAAV